MKFYVIEHETTSIILLMHADLSHGVPIALVKSNETGGFTLTLDYKVVNYYFKPRNFSHFFQYLRQLTAFQHLQ
jgi:hypothetical protein